MTNCGSIACRVAAGTFRGAGRFAALQGEWWNPFGTSPSIRKQKATRAVSGSLCLGDLCADDKRWGQINTFVADRLVTLEASALVAWREALRPAKGQLIKPLASIFRDTNQKEQARIYAAETLADYAADRPDELFDLLADAEQFQFPVLFEVSAYKERPSLWLQRNSQTTAGKGDRRQEGSFWRSDRPMPPWPCSGWEPGRESGRCSSSVLIRGFAATSFIGSVRWGSIRRPIIQRLDTEPDVTIRRALVLTLGEFTETQLPRCSATTADREAVAAIYENEPDAGLHGAAEWLLRKWGQAKRLEAVVEKLKSDEKQLQARKSSDNGSGTSTRRSRRS